MGDKIIEKVEEREDGRGRKRNDGVLHFLSVFGKKWKSNKENEKKKKYIYIYIFCKKDN